MHETLRRDRVAQLSTLAGGHVVVALFRLILLLEQANHCTNHFICRLERFVAALVHANQDGEVPAGSDPDVRKVHGVVTAVIKRFAAGPTALNHSPAKRVIAAEWRSLQLLIRFRLEQGGCATPSAQLVLDKLGPILNRAMNAASR